jgi:hypothetical protein
MISQVDLLSNAPAEPINLIWMTLVRPQFLFTSVPMLWQAPASEGSVLDAEPMVQASVAGGLLLRGCVKRRDPTHTNAGQCGRGGRDNFGQKGGARRRRCQTAPIKLPENHILSVTVHLIPLSLKQYISADGGCTTWETQGASFLQRCRLHSPDHRRKKNRNWCGLSPQRTIPGPLQKAVKAGAGAGAQSAALVGFFSYPSRIAVRQRSCMTSSPTRHSPSERKMMTRTLYRVC